MPTMVGLMVAVGVLRASGFLEFLAQMIGKVTQYIGFPGEISSTHNSKDVLLVRSDRITP